MGGAMTMGTRSEAQAATVPAVAAPQRKPSGPTALPQTVLWMQRTAGNAAVARAVGGRSIQRCGANCGCSSCGGGSHAHDDELLDEKFGAGLLRSAVARRSA